MAIPFVLFYSVRKRRDIPFRPILVLFAMFITGCGWTHFMGFYTSFQPTYYLDGAIKLLTAVVSLATVAALIPVTPKALLMRSPEELEAEVRARTAEVEELNRRLRRAMSETHHRVKNNLQIVSALVDLEASRRELIPASQLLGFSTHIRALASVHEVLTLQPKADDQVEDVSALSILNKLLPSLSLISGDRNLTLLAVDVRLPIRQATSMAVLVNEAVMNAVKYGSGAIKITLEREDDTAVLEIRNEGSGFPHGLHTAESGNTGLELIESLATMDLLGAIEFVNPAGGGALVSVRFPVQNPNFTADSV
jgi:two-component sensor histidine kinase